MYSLEWDETKRSNLFGQTRLNPNKRDEISMRKDTKSSSFAQAYNVPYLKELRSNPTPANIR